MHIDPTLIKFVHDVVTNAISGVATEGAKTILSPLLNKWKKQANTLTEEQLKKEIESDLAKYEDIRRDIERLPSYNSYKIHQGDITTFNNTYYFPLSQVYQAIDKNIIEHDTSCVKVMPYGTYSVFEKGNNDIQELFCVGVSMQPINSTNVPHDLIKFVKTKILMLSKYSILSKMLSDEAFSDASRFPKEKSASWVKLINAQYDDFKAWKGKKEYRNNQNLQIKVHKTVPFNGYTYIKRSSGTEEIYLTIYLNSFPGNNGPLIHIMKNSHPDLFDKLYKSHDNLWKRSTDILRDTEAAY